MTLLVPYRNRLHHLEMFVPFMVCNGHDVVIIEQADDKPFNRGKLLNIGFLETPTIYNAGHFVAHDIDMLPYRVDYSKKDSIVQLAKSNIQLTDYLGGVTMFPRSIFMLIGGYHNDYFHRAEDNEIWFNIRRLKIPVTFRFGEFINLPHKRTGQEFDPVLWQKAQLPRTKDMLKTCEYKLISKEVKDGYTNLKVEL